MVCSARPPKHLCNAPAARTSCAAGSCVVVDEGVGAGQAEGGEEGSGSSGGGLLSSDPAAEQGEPPPEGTCDTSGVPATSHTGHAPAPSAGGTCAPRSSGSSPGRGLAYGGTHGIEGRVQDPRPVPFPLALPGPYCSPRHAKSPFLDVLGIPPTPSSMEPSPLPRLPHMQQQQPPQLLPTHAQHAQLQAAVPGSACGGCSLGSCSSVLPAGV